MNKFKGFKKSKNRKAKIEAQLYAIKPLHFAMAVALIVLMFFCCIVGEKFEILHLKNEMEMLIKETHTYPMGINKVEKGKLVEKARYIKEYGNDLLLDVLPTKQVKLSIDKLSYNRCQETALEFKDLAINKLFINAHEVKNTDTDIGKWCDLNSNKISVIPK